MSQSLCRKPYYVFKFFSFQRITIMVKCGLIDKKHSILFEILVLANWPPYRCLYLSMAIYTNFLVLSKNHHSSNIAWIKIFEKESQRTQYILLKLKAGLGCGCWLFGLGVRCGRPDGDRHLVSVYHKGSHSHPLGAPSTALSMHQSPPPSHHCRAGRATLEP